MSSTLGQGYVALTPINLDTVPSAREGSKAGLLTLYWANVLAANKTYAQPVNLLQSYQTGQFTTVQALLIDNSQVAYPVTIFSRSTGQSVVVGPYTQQMVPLLVSVAPEFLITLNVPTGVVPQDQVATKFWFLNTPQAPYVSQTIPSGASVTGGAQTASDTAVLNQTVTDLGNPPYTVATLMAGFQAGTKTATYGAITFTVTGIAPASVAYNLTVQTTDGTYTQSVTASLGVIHVTPGQTGILVSSRFAYPANTFNTSGAPILLQLVFSGAGGPFPVNLSIGYSFSYTLI